MKYQIEISTRFKKDYKLAKKRKNIYKIANNGCNLQKTMIKLKSNNIIYCYCII